MSERSAKGGNRGVIEAVARNIEASIDSIPLAHGWSATPLAHEKFLLRAESNSPTTVYFKHYGESCKVKQGDILLAGTLLLIQDQIFELPFRSVPAIFHSFQKPENDLSYRLSFRDCQVDSITQSGQFTAMTSQGPKEFNEDAYLVVDTSNFRDKYWKSRTATHMLVMDGITKGGQARKIIDIAEQVFRYELVLGHTIKRSLDCLAREIPRYFSLHGQIDLDLANANSDTNKIGFCFASATVVGRFVKFMHCGDVRAYLIREGRIIHSTFDHNEPGDALRKHRKMDSALLFRHPDGHLVSRSVWYKNGQAGYDLPEQITLGIRAGDIVLIACDGLTDNVPNAKIAEICKHSKDPKRIREQLLKEVQSAAIKLDDTTILVYRHGN